MKETCKTTYLVINLKSLPRRDDAFDNASIYRTILKAFSGDFLLCVIFINVTVQRRWRPRIVFLVGARQTAAIRLRWCRAIIINYVIVIVIDLGLWGWWLKAFGFIIVALNLLWPEGEIFVLWCKNKSEFLVTAWQTHRKNMKGL